MCLVGNVQYVGLAAGCELNINGGTISSVYGGGNNCVVYDYTAGQALPADFKPYDMLYLSYDLTNKTVTGLLGGNVRLAQDFGVYAPSEWGDQAKMEVIILPGATATVNCFRFTGDLLVQGTLQASPDISTNPMVIGTTPTTPSTPTLKPWPAFPPGIPLSGTASPLCRRVRWLP